MQAVRAAVGISAESGLGMAAVGMPDGSEMIKTSAMGSPRVSGVAEIGAAVVGSSGASEVSAISCVVVVGASEGLEGSEGSEGVVLGSVD